MNEKIGDISIYCGDLLLKKFEIINRTEILRKTPLDYVKMISKNICKYLKM